MLADVFTPVGIYLRIRDRFRDTVLLESTDHHSAENSWSFIGINAIAGMEISSTRQLELKWPGQPPEKVAIDDVQAVPDILWNFMQRFEPANTKAAAVETGQAGATEGNAGQAAATPGNGQLREATPREARFAQGLYGYTTFDAVQFFDTIQLRSAKTIPAIPLMRYRLYQYVIAINHYKDELYICENILPGLESELALVESLIRSKDVPAYPFKRQGEEVSNMDDAAHTEMVKKGIQSCYRGDVFQIVLSRAFKQKFSGDEFNVYRALRNINPSPYLFFFDYGDYKLMGSSPESQLIIQQGKATVHPIAGTFRRTGDDETDKREAARLLADEKENAEHVMLVDLARNDLSRLCDEVKVEHYKQVQYYSHVIHMVSEVTGKVRPDYNPFELVAKTFPAGTLSGAPKFRAMELIDSLEPAPRSYYGGTIGFMGFDGSCNHAIMIRTFLSRQNTLHYQAGGGIVAASNPASELQEVINKLGALKKAIVAAEDIV